MDRAETVINTDTRVIQLPNQAIVDKMQEMGMNVDDRITHNPMFIINLFKLFDIRTIKDISFSSDGIVLTADNQKKAINVNAEGGLTMTTDIKDDNEGMHFMRSRKVISLFPYEDGFKKVVNYQQGFGHANLDGVVESDELSIVEVDRKGLEVSSNTVKQERETNGYIFGFQPKIEPLTSDEYNIIMSKQLETKAYIEHIERTRDSRNLTHVRENVNLRGRKIKHDLYFPNNEMYDLAYLSSANSTNPTNVDKLVENLVQRYDQFDPAVGRLMINLVNALNQDVTIRITKPTDHEKYLQQEILATFENDGKKLNV